MNNDILAQFLNFFDENNTIKIVFSKTKNVCKKIIARPVQNKNLILWQIEKYVDKKVFHENLTKNAFLDMIKDDIIINYKQINIINKLSSTQLLISSKGKISVHTMQTLERTYDVSHNRVKSYIFSEGDDIPALRDLGIFTQDNQIIKSKYDKFKQINRFIEIIDDEFKNFDKDEITIMDFGCGKSYLTFLIYYYFNHIRKVKINVYGYDLKKDVVDSCNIIAQKYGYTGLKFINENISMQSNINYKVDMIITLHACDTATDYALFNAIKNNVKYIFSVPCCQHEINSHIKASDDLTILLSHGLIKERFSALLTDAIRCELLKNYGYAVDVIEFVDFAHTPKNLMIRARKTSQTSNIKCVKELLERFNTKQKLYDLLTNYENN